MYKTKLPSSRTNVDQTNPINMSIVKVVIPEEESNQDPLSPMKLTLLKTL